MAVELVRSCKKADGPAMDADQLYRQHPVSNTLGSMATTGALGAAIGAPAGALLGGGRGNVAEGFDS